VSWQGCCQEAACMAAVGRAMLASCSVNTPATHALRRGLVLQLPAAPARQPPGAPATRPSPVPPAPAALAVHAPAPTPQQSPGTAAQAVPAGSAARQQKELTMGLCHRRSQAARGARAAPPTFSRSRCRCDLARFLARTRSRFSVSVVEGDPGCLLSPLLERSAAAEKGSGTASTPGCGGSCTSNCRPGPGKEGVFAL
jgi:hypothetical protein